MFGPSNSKHAGFVSQTTGSGEGRHVTAVIAVSAAGHKAPPFFIVQGKNVISSWFSHLDNDVYDNLPTSLESLLTHE